MGIFTKKIEFEKLRILALMPTRGTPESSGLDFFSPISVIIPPWKDVLIPLDLKVNLPKGYDLTFFNKSGVSTKKKLIVGACVVDSDYTGNIHAHLFNLSDKPVEINYGDKIVQGIIRKVELWDPKESKINKKTIRGAGGFGSTGTKLKSATVLNTFEKNSSNTYLHNIEGSYSKGVFGRIPIIKPKIKTASMLPSKERIPN